MPVENPSLLVADEGTTIPRLSLKETGYIGLKVSSGQIMQESQRAFRFPHFIKTVDEMRNNTTIGAAMNVYRFMLTRPRWYVKCSPVATEKELARAEVVESMLQDMEHTWEDFMHSIIPYLEYGFGINSIVFYRRLSRNGSKYNDGVVGIKKLPVRNQDSIVKWNFDDSRSTLLSVEQSLQFMDNPLALKGSVNKDGRITLDRDSFLLFTSSADQGNPQGNSIYKNIYLSYKQLTLLQDQQLLSVAKDVQGILKIEVPAEYLQGDASPDKGVAAAAFAGIIDSVNSGESRGLLVPQLIDQDSKLKRFSYELMSGAGRGSNDVQGIITGYQNDIAQALSVDILKLGANGSGSFALADQKSSILALAIDSRLREIRSTLNKHLMRKIYEMNGWELTNLPTFEYEDVEDVSLNDLGAFLQRAGAGGFIEVDRDVLNMVRRAIKVPEMPEDEPVNKDMLPANMSNTATKSGDSMSSNKQASVDKTVSNVYNAP
jgi:hypothetical protein